MYLALTQYVLYTVFWNLGFGRKTSFLTEGFHQLLKMQVIFKSNPPQVKSPSLTSSAKQIMWFNPFSIVALAGARLLRTTHGLPASELCLASCMSVANSSQVYFASKIHVNNRTDLYYLDERRLYKTCSTIVKSHSEETRYMKSTSGWMAWVRRWCLRQPWERESRQTHGDRVPRAPVWQSDAGSQVRATPAPPGSAAAIVTPNGFIKVSFQMKAWRLEGGHVAAVTFFYTLRDWTSTSRRPAEAGGEGK